MIIRSNFSVPPRRRALQVACILLFIIAVCVPGARGADQPAFHPNRVLIIPKAARAADAAQFHKKKGRKVAKKFAEIKGLEVVDLALGDDVMTAVREYQASGLVESAEPDYLLKVSVVPNDPSYGGPQWHLNNFNDADIDAPEGWNTRHDAPTTIVAIIDSGARLTHEDLAANLWTNTKEIPDNGIDDDRNGYIDDVHGISSIDSSGDPSDEDGHGTHVAGIIGAVGNNGKGISGVAWKVKLMPLKFIDSTGSGFTSDSVECVNYAIKQGAHVINASFGGVAFSTSMQTAISSARNAGIVFVAAAGNENTNIDFTPSYPAAYSLDNIISVCATGSSDTFESSYSNYGPIAVDVGAPGTMIYSCYNSSDTSYIYMSGTSMAAPVVSGIVALMKAQFPVDTPAQIRQRLLSSVDPLPSLAGKCASGGRVNLQRAIAVPFNAAFSSSALAGGVPLTVRFTNQSVGTISSYKWDFGDGSTFSTDPNPTHVFTEEDAYTVRLTVTGSAGQTATAAQTVSALPPYTYRSVAYEWIDPTGMTQLFVGDNGITGAQPLPFGFYFYGQVKNSIYIGANGLLGFDSANMQATSNADIPSAASPNAAIFAYWDNLNPSTAGAMYAGVIGQAPNRKYVVSWVSVPRNSSADNMTFQAVLSETTGQIQFNYLEVNPSSARGGGARATVGVEDPAGVLATKYCYNGSPNRVANGQSVLFVMGGTGGLTVTPDDVQVFTGSASELVTGVSSFTLKNTSRRPMLWSASNAEGWQTLSASSGVLAPQAQTTVDVRFNRALAGLLPGSYSDTISFLNLNNGQGDSQRTVSVEISAALEARFSAPTFADGVFHLEIPGAIGETFVIEASADLSEWTEVQRGVIGVSGVIPFNDASAGEGNRFFRAQVLP